MPIANSLAIYHVRAISGAEETHILNEFKVAALRMFQDAYQREHPLAPLPANIQGIPTNWKTHLNHWIISPSKARDILDRPSWGMKAVDFLDKLIERSKKEVNTMYDPSFRDMLVDLTKPQSMDRHNRQLFEYYFKFYVDHLQSFVAQSLDEKAVALAHLLDNAHFNKAPGIELKTNISALLNVEARAGLSASIRDRFVEKSLCAGLQAIVASDPKLFVNLDKESIPLSASSDDLTDMFQEQILNPKSSNIALKVVNGVSPLSPVVVTSPKANAGHAEPTKAGRDFRSKEGRDFSKSPRTTNSTSSTTSAGTPTTTNSGAGKGTTAVKSSNCAFCKKTYPNSVSYKWHSNEHCFRNPVSKNYDTVRAATLPTK